MSKSLKTVQTVCKVCKVLAEIAFVLLVVSAVLMLACGIFIGAGKLDALLLSGGVVLDDMLQQTGVTQERMVTAFICLTVMLVAEAVVAKFINVYFKHELKAGTPFTFEGAKEMLRLGIITIAVPAAASVIIAIYFAVMMSGDLTFDFSIEISVSLGIVFLALSPLLKHGAELRAKAQLAEEKPADSEEDNL